MAAIQKQSSGIGELGPLLELFLGKSGSSSSNVSGTTTTKESISQAGVDAIVKSILEGNSGLASVASGQKSSGMYNSSTNKLLLNDLVARAAAEGAKANKSTTTSTNNSTNTSTNQNAQINPLKTAGGLLASSFLSPVLKAGAKKYGITNPGQDFADYLFGSSAEAGLGGLGIGTGGATSLGAAFNPAAFEAANYGAEALSSVAPEVSSSLAGSIGEGVGENLASTVGEEAASSAGEELLNTGLEEGGSDLFSWLFADGGRVPMSKAKGYANGGVVTATKTKKLGSEEGIGAEGNTSNIGSVSNGMLGAMASMGLSAITGNPIGLAMSIGNMASQATTGQSMFGNMLSAVGLGNNNPGAPGGLDSNSGIDGTSTGLGNVGNLGSISGVSGETVGESEGNGESAGEGEGEGGLGFATGGKVPGHDTKGSDNIPVKLTGGEFIVPTDVVDTIGQDFFDNLLKMFHSPVGGK